MVVVDFVKVDVGEAIDHPAQARKRGRSPIALWSWCTDNVSPQRAKIAKCMHFKIAINHHKTTERAMTHLKACAKFCTLMNGMHNDEYFDWFE